MVTSHREGLLAPSKKGQFRRCCFHSNTGRRVVLLLGNGFPNNKGLLLTAQGWHPEQPTTARVTGVTLPWEQRGSRGC